MNARTTGRNHRDLSISREGRLSMAATPASSISASALAVVVAVLISGCGFSDGGPPPTLSTVPDDDYVCGFGPTIVLQERIVEKQKQMGDALFFASIHDARS